MEVKIQSGSALTPKGKLIVLNYDLTFSEFGAITEGDLYIKYDQQREAPQQRFIEGSETRWVETPSIIFTNEDSGSQDYVK